MERRDLPVDSADPLYNVGVTHGTPTGQAGFRVSRKVGAEQLAQSGRRTQLGAVVGQDQRGWADEAIHAPARFERLP